MKYFKSKIVRQGTETLSFVAPKTTGETPVHYMYDRQGDIEYHGLADDIDLPQQHAECEVEELAFEAVEETLHECRFYKEINAQIESRIRAKYSIGDEFALVKLGPGNPEFDQYQSFVDQCRQDGLDQKIELGLKQ